MMFLKLNKMKTIRPILKWFAALDSADQDASKSYPLGTVSRSVAAYNTKRKRTKNFALKRSPN